MEDAKFESEKAQYLQDRWNEFDWGMLLGQSHVKKQQHKHVIASADVLIRRFGGEAIPALNQGDCFGVKTTPRKDIPKLHAIALGNATECVTS